MNDFFINGIHLRFVMNRMIGVKELGHVCFCLPLDNEPDAVSAVANTGGFVPCVAVGNFLGMRPACLLKAVSVCNATQRVYVVTPCEVGRRLRDAVAHTSTPAFILTPRPPDYRLFDEESVRRALEGISQPSSLRQIAFGLDERHAPVLYEVLVG